MIVTCINSLNIFLFRYAFNHIGSRYLPPFDNKTGATCTVRRTSNELENQGSSSVFSTLVYIWKKMLFYDHRPPCEFFWPGKVCPMLSWTPPSLTTRSIFLQLHHEQSSKFTAITDFHPGAAAILLVVLLPVC